MKFISCRLLLLLLLFSSMFRRKLDKHIFERRVDFVNFGVTHADTARLTLSSTSNAANEIKALTATVEEQASAIQKVNARLEARPNPRRRSCQMIARHHGH
jgi:hypothetical protein